MGQNHIKRLPEALINQIAAGEVVERPASILKESIENSLDAKSTQIEIFLRQGGMEEITVIDNGSGISKEDLPLAIERHATSKINTDSDLLAITTYGFRGEALSSAASVCDLTLASKARPIEGKEQEGHSLSVFFGEIKEIKPHGMNYGTKLICKNIFSRIPARLKFMRSSSTEFSHASKIIKELALGNPATAFYLSHENRQVFSFLATSQETRVGECLKHLTPLTFFNDENEDVQYQAYLSPTDQISDKGELHLFINQRPVKNRSLIAAVRNSYLDTMGPHHDPSGVVYLKIKNDWVDVNVHPQKWEVRCFKEERIYHWLHASLSKKLAQSKTIRNMSLNDTVENEPVRDLKPFSATPNAVLPYTRDFTPPPQQQISFSDTKFATPIPQTQSRFRYLGQVKASYLVCEDENGIVLIDQHALHEKNKYEELKKKLIENTITSQSLLIPKILLLSTEESSLAEENQAFLLELGFEFDAFSDKEIAVKAIPSVLNETDAVSIFKELLKEIAEHRLSQTPLNRMILPKLATKACHSAIRANHLLTDWEAKILIGQLGEIEEGWTCPHGRPILFRISFAAMERHFERK